MRLKCFRSAKFCWTFFDRFKNVIIIFHIFNFPHCKVFALRNFTQYPHHMNNGKNSFCRFHFDQFQLGKWIYFASYVQNLTSKYYMKLKHMAIHSNPERLQLESLLLKFIFSLCSWHYYIRSLSVSKQCLKQWKHL